MSDTRIDDPVRGLVRRGVVTVLPEATLREVAVVMDVEEVGAVVVVAEARSVGVLSERDLVRAVAAGDDVDDVRAEDVMAMEVVTVAMDDTVADAANGMLDGAIRHLPVVDGEAVVGVVSIRDVLQAYLTEAR